MSKQVSKAEKKKEADSFKAQAIDAAKKDEYMSASFYAMKALKLYGEISDGKGVQELKKLSVEYTKKSEEQMQSHEISIPLDEKMVTALEEIVTGLTSSDSLEENLEKIVNTRELLPSFQQAKKTAKEIVPVTAQLVTHIGVGDDGHITSFDNFEDSWLLENYGFQMNLTISLLDRVMSELIIKKQLNANNLMEIITSKGIFAPDFLLKLEAGLERRFANDYFSSLHILVPLFEKTFMHFSGLLGLDVYTYNGKKISTRNKTLSIEILQSKEYIDVWGEDYCYLVGYFLYDPNAQRFRHKIAHGDIRMNECNFTTFNIVFYLLLRVLLKVKLTPKD